MPGDGHKEFDPIQRSRRLLEVSARLRAKSLELKRQTERLVTYEREAMGENTGRSRPSLRQSD